MVERIDFDDVDNSAIVSFKTRQDAEHVSHYTTLDDGKYLTIKEVEEVHLKYLQKSVFPNDNTNIIGLEPNMGLWLYVKGFL